MPNIIIYTKPGCGECVQAKMLIQLKGDTAREVNIAESHELYETFKAEWPSVRSLPLVLIDGAPHYGVKGLKEYYDGNSKQYLTEVA